MNTADLQRLIENLIRLGTIAEVDFAALDHPRCRVQVGEITTAWLPFLTLRAGRVRIWSPPSPGEQVVVLSPSGELTNGLVLVGLFSSDRPAPSDNPDLDIIQYDDGAVIRYDQASHALQALLPASGTFSITADGGLSITGPVSITGNVDIEGGLTTTEDVVIKDVSFLGHKHSGVAPGMSQTAIPVGAVP